MTDMLYNKNNILLITAVTIISLGIIAAVIVLSASGKSEESDSESEQTSSQTAASTTAEDAAATDEPQPEIIVVESEDGSDESEEPVSDETDYAAGIVDTARSLVGTPFVDGGETPSGFDNSGFIYYVLRENGYITCPRGVAAQSEMGTRLDFDELSPGDLVFFLNESGNGAGYGGIYVGGGSMIACLMPGTDVREIDISSGYYRNNFYHGISLS